MNRAHILISVFRARNILGESPRPLLHPNRHLVSPRNGGVFRILGTIAGSDPTLALLDDKPAVELAVAIRLP